VTVLVNTSAKLRVLFSVDPMTAGWTSLPSSKKESPPTKVPSLEAVGAFLPISLFELLFGNFRTMAFFPLPYREVVLFMVLNEELPFPAFVTFNVTPSFLLPPILDKFFQPPSEHAAILKHCVL